MEIDLDAARAARAETREPKWVLLGGKKWDLPAEMPWDYVELVDGGDVKGALRLLLADQFDGFWAQGLSADDLKEATRQIPRMYGFGGPGESSASGGSSAPTGNPSKPTSPAATGSTSARRSGARSRSG